MSSNEQSSGLAYVRIVSAVQVVVCDEMLRTYGPAPGGAPCRWYDAMALEAARRSLADAPS